MAIRHLHRRFAAWALLGVGLVASMAAAVGADGLSTDALRGLDRMSVTVDGIAPTFARYGLTAAELRDQVVQRLAASGIEVVDAAAAHNDAAAGELRIKLTTVESSYAFYSYAIAAEARRKVPLAPAGSGYVVQTVWSRSQNGVLNPSDLKKVYGYVDGLLDTFIAERGTHNVPAGTVSSY